MTTKAVRKAAFQALFKASGLTLRGAPAVLKESIHTLTAHLKTEDTTAGPSMELIERLRDIVVAKAKSVIRAGWEDEVRNPLSKEEVLAKPAQQLDFRISLEEEHGIDDAETYPLDIVGRTGLLGRVGIPRKGRSLAAMREEILEAAWESYRRGINIRVPELSPDQARIRAKERLRGLRDGLNLSNEDIAEMTERSVPAVRSWVDLKRPNVPPESVIAELRMQLQKWAHDTVIAASLDRDLLISAVDYVPKPEIKKIEGSEFRRGRKPKAMALDI